MGWAWGRTGFRGRVVFGFGWFGTRGGQVFGVSRDRGGAVGGRFPTRLAMRDGG